MTAILASGVRTALELVGTGNHYYIQNKVQELAPYFHLVRGHLYIWIKCYLLGIVKSFNIANRYIVTLF